MNLLLNFTNELRKIRSLKRRLNITAVLLIIFCWGILYLPHLRTSPAWYGDESLTHHTARDLAQGHMTNFALWNTFWHPHYPYQPLYTWVCGIFANAFGGDLLGSRLFNVTLAAACALSIFAFGRRSFGTHAALFSALMFLCYDQSIIHFRMSYAHNGAGLGLLIMTLFLLRPASPRNDWKAGIGLLIAAGSHPLFIHGAITGGLCRLKRPKSWMPLIFPSVIYLLVSMAWIYAVMGNWLLEDLAHLKDAFTIRGASDGGGWKGAVNFLLFAQQDWFHMGAVSGLVACLFLRRYAATIIGLLTLFLLVKNRQNLILFYYQAVVILPVLCLGWAGLYRLGTHFLRRYTQRTTARWMEYAFWIIPVSLFLGMLMPSIKGNLIPRNAYWTTQSIPEVEAAATWLNAHTTSDDTVGGNANISWLLKAKTIPYLQMITWYGIPTQGYENGNARERFRFNASLENTRYAVIGDIDRRWTFSEPNVNQIMDKLINERWPVVWSGENYIILQNPRGLESENLRKRSSTEKSDFDLPDMETNNSVPTNP